jgi:3',5'-cyclic AMP phosphodiesterase CpdA
LKLLFKLFGAVIISVGGWMALAGADIGMNIMAPVRQLPKAETPSATRAAATRAGTIGTIPAEQTTAAAPTASRSAIADQLATERLKPVEAILQPAAADSNAPLASFGLMSDIHVQESDAESHRRFAKALRDHARLLPDADLLVINGDLTNGAAADYVHLDRLLAREPHPPVHATMGNHDYYRMWLHNGRYDYTRLSADWSSAKAVEQFRRFFGYSAPYHQTIVRGVPFLFLSPEAYRDVDPAIAEDAWLSDAQLDWLEDQLAAHRHRFRQGSSPKRRTPPPALIFLHQPLPGTVDGSSLERGVVQHERLRSILTRYPGAVLFSGHTHWDWGTTKQVWRGPFIAVGSGSVHTAYSAGNRPIVPHLSESLTVRAYADRIAIRAFDHTHDRWLGPPAVLRTGD